MAEENKIEEPETTDTETETGALPENEIQHEETMSEDAKIENSVSTMKEKYGNKFDAEGYKQALKEQKEKSGTIEGVSAESFVKNDDSKDAGSMSDGENNGYSLQEKNGKIYAKGTNGKVLEGNNFEEINDKICDDLAKNCRARGKEATIAYNGNDEEQKKVFSRNAIMKHDITIMNGWPKDKEFWKNLKEEYLKDPDHALKDWERMTRKVPDDVMDRTKEESERNKKLNDTEMLKKMRMGKNPNLEAKEDISKTLQKQPQKQTKDMTAARLKALRGNSSSL